MNEFICEVSIHWRQWCVFMYKCIHTLISKHFAISYRTCYVDLKDHSKLSVAIKLSGSKVKGHTITVGKVAPKPSLQNAATKQKEKTAKRVKENGKWLFVVNFKVVGGESVSVWGVYT